MDTVTHLVDPQSAGLVLGGTLLATFVLVGLRMSRMTLFELAQWFRPSFKETRVKAELAGVISDMLHDGVIRAHPRRLSDREFTDATQALVRHRSISALVGEHERHQAIRSERRRLARETLDQAGELAPVFGLAGTLLALSQLPHDFSADGELMGAISTAVTSTFYGLMLAHLLFNPLARAVERRGMREEKRRHDLIVWLAEQVAAACPAPSSEKRAA